MEEQGLLEDAIEEDKIKALNLEIDSKLFLTRYVDIILIKGLNLHFFK